MDNTIKIFRNVDELSHFFALKIQEGVRNTPAGKFYSLALSGGSTPRKVFEYIASHFKEQVNWQKILVFWSDEQCVDPRSDESNYRMAKESLLDQVPVPAENIFRIHGEADAPAEAERYSGIIMQKVPLQHKIPQFDLLMLGLGDDGHTVSIFPGSLHLFDSVKLCEVAVNPHTMQKRITVTGKIINQAKSVVFLVTGASKAEAVASIIERKDGWEKLPASLVNPGSGEVFWLLDEAASANLNRPVKPE